MGKTRTDFLLDGSQVAAEVQGNTVCASYLWGINLVSRKVGGTTENYLYNAHGDVVQLADSTGKVTRSYDYDTFGNEKSPSDDDNNPFRYCGEYFDSETGTYYLRARYYDPVIERFTQQDTHWNTANMIYGNLCCTIHCCKKEILDADSTNQCLNRSCRKMGYMK